MKIGIVNAGGDCAGLNATISAIVKAAKPHDIVCVGFERGWEGVLDNKYRQLDIEAIKGISHLGGTILHTTNKGRFAGKIGEGHVNEIPGDILTLAKNNIQSLGLDGLVVIGGDGTLSAATQLSNIGVNIIGIPKTIDNDLSGTDATFGFSTAVDVAAEAIDKIHTTATSHERVFFVECMGRHTGWISLFAGLAANASAILIPEFAIDMNALIEVLRTRQQTHGYSIVVVAEGIEIAQVNRDPSRPESFLHGAAESVIREILARTSDEFEMRSVVLGHIQRGGNPNAEDRILAKRYGVAAVQAYVAKQFAHMVRLRGNVIETVPILEAIGSLKKVTLNDPFYQTAKSLGVFIN